MAIKISYKGWEFEFDGVPSSEEIAKRYHDRVANTDIVMPVPNPTPLQRNNGPYGDSELAGTIAVWSSAQEPQMRRLISETLTEAGAEVRFAEDEAPAGQKHAGLVVDLTAETGREGLDAALYGFVQSHFRKLSKCAHVVILCRPTRDASSSAQAAAWEATDGFVRTLAKELGPLGGTVNRFVVPRGADRQVAAPLAFFLSHRSAYVSAQTIRIGALEAAAAAPRTRILEGKTAIITGAARGIGRATAIQFVREGATVIGIDVPTENELNLEGSEDLLDELQREYGVVPLLADISAPDCPARIAALAQAHGGVDILVNNAVLLRDGMFYSLPEDFWRRALDVNLDATHTVTDELLQQQVMKDGGRVIFISSVAGVSGNVGQINYTTSKTALLGLTQFYAAALQERGITVNAVLAGPTDTRHLKSLAPWIQVIGHRLNALGQAGRPEDIANLITFLAGSGASALNGEHIRCCGAALQGA